MNELEELPWRRRPTGRGGIPQAKEQLCCDREADFKLADFVLHLNQKQEEANMSINIKTPGVHHVALRVTDYERAKRFYVDTLGFQIALEKPNLFIFFAGSSAVAVRGPEAETPKDDKFNPFRVGLDHVALACEDEAEIERVAKALADAGVENTGVKVDETLGKKYVAFKDPDRIAWELYMK